MFSTALLQLSWRWRPVLLTAALLPAVWLATLLKSGIQARRRMLKLKAQGLPVPEPYSVILGHLPLMMRLRKNIPSDAHDTYADVVLATRWHEFFPHMEQCPPVMYVDVWPFMAEPIVYILQPELCAQLTQESPQPRHPLVRWAQYPVTRALDMISVSSIDMGAHRVWRGRFNPAFSAANLAANTPGLIQHVEVFVEKLKAKTGQEGQFGDMFTLYESVIFLTVDVIIQYSLGIDLEEQVRGPGPVLQALRYLMSQVGLDTAVARLSRLTPSYLRQSRHHAGVLRNIVQKRIESGLRDADVSASQGGRTFIDVALQKYDRADVTDEVMSILSANINLLLLAGHDTTAQSICWVFWEMHKHPELLAKVQQEHDQILGPREQAADLLRQTPQRLNELPYTTAVIKETLRVHNVAAAVRRAKPEFSLTHNGVAYPVQDTLLLTMPNGMNMRKELWLDPAQFIPERFLVPEGDPLRPVKNAFRPFEMGPTRCIGEDLAMMEMAIVMVLTFRDFKFDVNYRRWVDQENPAGTAKVKGQPLQNVDGDEAYRCGSGTGLIKHDLPIRVARI